MRPSYVRRARSLGETYVVWLLFFLAAVAVFVTYWRLPPAVLWKVHNTGFIGGSGRAYVFLSFSASLAAIGILPIVLARLEDRRADLAGLVAFLLCATVAPPGGQAERHLDPTVSHL